MDMKLSELMVEQVASGNVGVVTRMVADGADVNLVDKTGWTALIWLALEGQCKPARILLEHGADANIKDEVGSTALSWAAYKGHVNFVRLLLEYGARIDERDNFGRTALMQAERRGRVEVVQLLLAEDPSVNRTSKRQTEGSETGAA